MSGLALGVMLLSDRASPASARGVAVLPPEVITADPLSYYPRKVLRRFDSTPLWTTNALDGYEARYRLTIYSISVYSYQVTVDRKLDGATSSLAKVAYRNELTDNRRIAWRTADYEELESEVMAAHLWDVPDEKWVTPQRKDEICLDGTEVILERLDRRGYAISRGNLSRDAMPEGVLAQFSTMIRIAQLKSQTGGSLVA
jgi:hypothetical protein